MFVQSQQKKEELELLIVIYSALSTTSTQHLLLITRNQGLQEGRDGVGSENTLIQAWFGSVFVEGEKVRVNQSKLFYWTGFKWNKVGFVCSDCPGQDSSQ